MSKHAFLDFDDTIFDTRRMTNDLYSSFESFDKHTFRTLYQKLREHHPFTPSRFAKMVEREHGVDHRIILERLNTLPSPDYVFDDVKPFLTELRVKNYSISIVTRGMQEWQETKVKRSGLIDMVDNVMVTNSLKGEELQGSNQLCDLFVDDKATEVTAFAKAFPATTCVHLLRFSEPDKNSHLKNARTLSEVITFLD